MRKLRDNLAGCLRHRNGRRQIRRLAALLTAVLVINNMAPVSVIASQNLTEQGDGGAQNATPSDSGDDDESLASPSEAEEDADTDADAETDAGSDLAATATASDWKAPALMSVAQDGDGVIRIQAENYYDNCGKDGEDGYASLKENDSLSVPLGSIDGFTAGNYLVRMRVGFSEQILTVAGNSSSTDLLYLKFNSSLMADSIECLDVLTLEDNDTLTIGPGGTGKWTWIDWIELESTEEKRVRYQAKDYVDPKDKITGDYNGTQICANMSGEGSTVPEVKITLGNDFEEGAYSLLMTTTGFDRDFSVQVNDGNGDGLAGTYSVTNVNGDNPWSTEYLHDDSWQGSYKLKAGDTVTIKACSSYGWLKDIVFKKVVAADPQGGVTVEGDRYIFEGENYYDRLTDDRTGAALQPNSAITISLADVKDTVNFKPGNYLVQTVYAGNGQIMPLQVGSVSSEMIFPPSDFGWENSKTAESMDVFTLTGDEILTLTNNTQNNYTWIDKIILVPTTEHRIRLNVDDPAVNADARTGDAGGSNCANMNPGSKITITLDSRFSEGQYAMQLFACGNDRTYSVSVNGEDAGSYEVPNGTNFGTGQLLGSGWQDRYELKEGDTVVITAPGDKRYGWIKDIVFKELPAIFYKKDAATGIIVEAEEGAVPGGTKLVVKEKGKVGTDSFSDEGLRAVGYQIRLISDGHELDLTADEREGKIQVTIPLPAGFDLESENVEMYVMEGEDGEPLRANFSEDGKGLTAYMTKCGIYAVSMDKGVYHYEAENYYSATSDNGNAANFEVGNGKTITIPLRAIDGFERGQYNMLVNYCGGGDKKLDVSVNGSSVAQVSVAYTDWQNYRLAPAEGVLDLHASDVLEITVPEGQYHWIDYFRLVEAEPFEDTVDDVTVEAAVGSLPYGAYLSVEDADGDVYMDALHDRFALGRIVGRYIRFYFSDDTENPVTPATAVKVRMALPEGMDEGSYCLYYVSGSGAGMKCTKVPSKVENGELIFTITKETGLFALVEGAAYCPENYDETAIYTRSGGRVGANDIRGLNGGQLNAPVKTRMDGAAFIYEGEGYYKAQGGTLTADLQPGAQINIPLSDNPLFKAGNYTLAIRSNGNRQKFIIKVNHQEVGNVLRAETSFDMSQMNDAVLAAVLTLSPSDILTVEGEGGNYYGWVDYIALAPAPSAGEDTVSGKKITYKGTDLYEKAANGYAAADLQPGDSLTFRAGDHPDFVEGDYRIAVTSNGNRTRLGVKVNGEMMGSIVRVTGSGFEKSDFTCNVMNRTLHLRADDMISIEAPGTAEEGPWGWIETIQLLPAPQATGQQKAEYRYDGEDFYQASLYSPAADLQPGTSIVIPVSNDPDFCEGIYRLSILSNGTRERFHIRVNGRPVGDIRRKATDYSDIDYSQDYLGASLTLRPGDVLTITGQDGDFYGWVNYILLERAE